MRNTKLKICALLAGITLAAGCTDNNTSPTGDDRDLFTGTWTCVEQSKLNGTTTFAINITKAGTGDNISIQNFYDLGSGYQATAFIAGNSITIPLQTISGISMQGTGIKTTASKIDLTYYANVSGARDTVTATCSR